MVCCYVTLKQTQSSHFCYQEELHFFVAAIFFDASCGSTSVVIICTVYLLNKDVFVMKLSAMLYAVIRHWRQRLWMKGIGLAKRKGISTFLWRFLHNRRIKTSSNMAPMAIMMTGKLDTTFMTRSSVFIWAAESSSMVAVWTIKDEKPF